MLLTADRLTGASISHKSLPTPTPQPRGPWSSLYLFCSWKPPSERPTSSPAPGASSPGAAPAARRAAAPPAASSLTPGACCCRPPPWRAEKKGCPTPRQAGAAPSPPAPALKEVGTPYAGGGGTCSSLFLLRQHRNMHLKITSFSPRLKMKTIWASPLLLTPLSCLPEATASNTFSCFCAYLLPYFHRCFFFFPMLLFFKV